MKIILEIPLEYGIFFLSDPYSPERIPQDAGERKVTSSESCLAIVTTGYVDGDAIIEISSTDFKDSECLFEGVINSASRILSISDGNKFNYCLVPLVETSILAKVYQRNDNSLERIFIYLDKINVI